MIVAIKEVGKDIEFKEIGDVKYRSDVFKEFIKDAYLESVTIYDNPQESSFLAMLVDEDGLLKELPTNFYLELDNPLFPIQKIVGKVMFVRVKKLSLLEEAYDYEVIDLTEGDKIRLAFVFGDNYQSKLKEMFIRNNNPLY